MLTATTFILRNCAVTRYTYFGTPRCVSYSKNYSQSLIRDGLLLGMGNPLLDISAAVDESFLEAYSLKANDAILASEKHLNLYKDLIDKYEVVYTAGGSCQNALRVAQWLLEKPDVTTFFGSVGVDKWSKILENKAREDGVNPVYQYNEDEPTGTCAVLLTGTHRSLCANLAAANRFTVDHIQKPKNRKLIEAAQYYYVTGFFLTVCPPAIMEVAKSALSQGKHFIMNMSAPFICEFYKEQLMQVLPYVDILFGNEAEAETFATVQNLGTKDLEEIALMICRMPKQNEKRPRICVITHGKDPVILATEGSITRFPVNQIPVDNIIDTNGAGDAFCGGFLSQYIQGQDLSVCIKCGNWAASQIVQRSGCTFEGKPMFEL